MEPFTVNVPEAVLADLRDRLDRVRLPNQIADIGWDQGTELGVLDNLLDHWRHGYDWRATEARLNAFPQMLTEVDGQRIHLIHARSANPDALPLLVSHGWPGSVMELLDVIEPLTEHFHVVAPSLPGFTFSGPTSVRGWHARKIAEAFAEVMARLGYDRYGVQGGDWGSVVSVNLADLHPERVAGLHLNMLTASRPTTEPAPEVTPEEQAYLDRFRAWRPTGVAYQEIQGTKPQSLGYALEDSPSGLAAWIVEKFQDWSHADVTEAFTPDRLLDNICAYWVTRTATSSLRIYWEMRNAGGAATVRRRVDVPTALARFPGEIVHPPRSWVEPHFNIVRWSSPARGGHFAAMEAPDEYLADVRAFFLDDLAGAR